MSRRITPSPARNPFPSGVSANAKPAELALAAAGAELPAIVCFLNNEDHPDRRSEHGALSSKPARDSLSITQMFTSPRIEDFSEAVMLFHVVFVDVTSVEQSTCTAVNFATAPFIAVIGVDGKVCKVLGPGLPTKEDLLSAMRTALKPKLDLEKFLIREREYVKALMKHDAAVATIEARRDSMATAEKNGSKHSADALAEDIRKLEAEEAKMAADLAAQEAAIQTLLDAAGLKRFS